jgi:hypothetical protein
MNAAKRTLRPRLERDLVHTDQAAGTVVRAARVAAREAEGESPRRVVEWSERYIGAAGFVVLLLSAIGVMHVIRRNRPGVNRA